MLKYSIKYSVKIGKLRSRVSFNSERAELYTGLNCEPFEFDTEAQVFKSVKDKRNSELERLKIIVKDIFSDYSFIHKRFPTKQELTIQYNEKKNFNKKETTTEPTRDANDITFIRAIEKYIENKSALDSWSVANFNRFNKLINHVKFFNEDLRTLEIHEKDLVDFMRYFQTEPINIKTGEASEPHKNTTVARTFKDVRAVLRWCKNKGFYTGELHDSFYPKLKGSNFELNEPIFFSWNELMLFYELEFEAKESHLEVTRDIIAFCCFTSLRYSDAFNLRKTALIKDSVKIVTQKDTDAIRIELNDFSRALVEKYKTLETPYVFPRKQMKDANEQIKVIGERMKLYEPYNYVYFVGEKRHEIEYKKYEVLSTHVGRKSFIVNGLFLGIPAEVIMKWTGHSDYKTMKPYIAIVDSLKSQEMDKFNRNK